MSIDLTNIRLLIFDLDGTLVDSAQGIVDTVNAVLLEHNLPIAPYAHAAALIGLPLVQFWRTFAPSHEVDWDAMTQRYRTIYHTTAIPNSRAFAGVVETIQHVHAQGYVLTIASSKITPVSRQVLTHIGLLDYFSVLMGDDRVSQHKPHPEMLERTLGETGFRAEQAVMIGDSEFDIQMGQSAGIRTIAVLEGAFDRTKLLNAQPNIIVEHLSDLVRIIP